MSRCLRRLVPSLLLCLALVASARPARATLDLHEVLANFDRVQQSILTLSADFTETTKSTLLKDEIVARGKVFLTKPNSVRWEYSAPEEMRFVIANDEYTGYFPLRHRAEKRNVQRYGEQLFRFLGIGQASDELAKFYDIRLDREGSNANEIRLILDPKKKRVRKRMESVSFWIDAKTYLPVRVRYVSSSGSTRVIEFGKVDVNPDIAMAMYDLELPAGVEITKGFSALSGLGQADASGN
jgi:outer membrane lipoprotein-sorting protein